MKAITVKGMDKVMKNVRDLAKQMPLSAMRSLNRQAEFIMTDSKQNYCPVDEGEMRASGHVVPEPEKLQVTLGYGGPAGIGNQGETNKDAVGYAIVQHETRSFSHTVGEDKFLEKPVMKAIPTLGKDIAEDIRRDLESGLS